MMASTEDPQREFALDVVRRLVEAGYQALWAGGCVRDLLLGKTPKDYDVATNAVPDEVRKIFGKRSTQTVGANFGVIIVHGPKRAGNVEVATFRTDGSYLDGRRPESVEFSTPEEDALRRDFTINGMFYDPLEQIVLDYVGGERDLGAGIVRAIGDPHDRVREDKLRMLRAVRFAATLEFELDEVTAAAIREMAEEIHVVSVERITQELKRMLLDPHRARAMELSHDLGLLQECLPELRPLFNVQNRKPSEGLWDRTLHMLSLLQQPDFELAFATLLHEWANADDAISDESVELLCRRLRFSNRELERVVWLWKHRLSLENARELPLSQLKRLAAHDGFSELMALVRVALLVRNGDLGSLMFVEEFVRNTPRDIINPPELLSGNDLIQLGMTPGPRFKELLIAVRDAQLNEEIQTREEAVSYLNRFLDS